MAALGVAPADGCGSCGSRSAVGGAFLFKLSEQIVRTGELGLKLKVEVCVRTGTKFVSEQGLRLTVRVSPEEDVLCVTVCMCVCV